MLIEGYKPFLPNERVKYNSIQYGCGVGYVINYNTITDIVTVRGEGGTPWEINLKSNQVERF